MNRVRDCLGVVLLWLALTSVAFAQWQIAEITVPDGQPNEDFGYSIGVSGQILAAEKSFSSSSGAVYLFQADPKTGWRGAAQVAKLTTSDSSRLYQMAITENGKVVVAGSQVGQGKVAHAYVWVEPPTGWADATETAVLSASDGVPDDLFAYTIAANGPTILVGAPGGPYQPGAVYLYVEPQSGWTNMTETAKLTPSNRVVNDNFGLYLSIYGYRAAIGAPPEVHDGVTPTGNLYAFQEPLTGWTDMTETAQLALPVSAGNGECQNYFGPVAENAGTVVSVGIYCVATAGGGAQATAVAYVYEEPAGGWVSNELPNARLTMKEMTNYATASSVALESDTVVLGNQTEVNQWNDDWGSGFVYFEPAGGWKKATQNMRLVPKYPYTYAGASVAIESREVFLGAPGTTVNGVQNQGAVFVFTAKYP